jgi:hypothetical protein
MTFWGVPPVYSSALSNNQLGELDSSEARKYDLRAMVRILSRTGYQIKKTPSLWGVFFLAS